MLRSMTAYGRAQVTVDRARFLIEIHSVNRKSLDIMINLPKELLSVDMEFRKILREEIKRGFVTVRISREGAQEEGALTIPKLETLKELQGMWQKYAKELGFDPKEAISFHELLNYGLSIGLNTELDEDALKALLKGFKEALDAFIQMRKVEGEALLKDIYERLDHIQQKVQEIRELAKHAPEKYQEKLKKRLEELNLLNAEGDERLLRELVIFADKIDITEELTRLTSHDEQFRSVLASEKMSVGRELDFLIQEMNREVNTTSSKSQDIEMTRSVLAIKSELEKIREQVQNIE